jgi:serine protease AprX
MSKTKLFFNGIVILTLVLVALGITPMTAQAGNGNDELKADPRLLQMAEENPNAVFMVIVQKEAKNKDLNDVVPEVAIERSGGRVTKQLDLITSFSAELTGKELTKLAKNPKVRWISADAPMVSTGTPGMDKVQDDFSARSYSGNNGTVTWKSSWLESGESTSATSGLIQAVSNSACAGGSGNCLSLKTDPPVGIYIYRSADLSGAVYAGLSVYRNNLLNANKGKDDQVKLEISANDGATWTTLKIYSGSADTGKGVDTFDISAYASPNTLIRFMVSKDQSGTRYIYFDNITIFYARPSVFRSAVKADQLSMNGSGVTVAVIDSGITALHTDFYTSKGSRVTVNTKFGSSVTTEDLYGHGTHVAGIIGGSGYASSGKYMGMAPGVNLLNVKVTDDYGMTYESDVVNALQWVYNNKDAYKIRVVNLSLNSTVAQSYHTSPLAAAVEILWFNGIVVVVSAGNNGTADGPSVIYPPANDPFVITVGATEDKSTASLGDDTLAVFSAYGKTTDGFSKPDLVAPGRNVVAPLGGLLNIIYQLHPMHRVDNYYFRMSGTSMSAPVVSGAVALLLQDEPKLTPDQVKYRLMATANKNWNYDPAQSGAGYLDAYAAVNGTTTESANTGIMVSQMLTTGSNPVTWGSVGWNSVGWNSVGWNSVGWNSVGWNSVGWNSVGWNTSTWDD